MLVRPERPIRANTGRHARAWDDLRATVRLWRLCVALARHDLRLRYQGSVLGPLWLTVSTFVSVIALGGVFTALLRVEGTGYVPYLAVSLVLWNALAGLAGEASQVFTQQAATIRGLPLPFAVHAARLLLRHIFAAAHAALVLPAVFLWYGVWPGAGLLWLVPGLLLWLGCGFFLVLALGALGARFRDIPPIVASLTQLAFFVTPVLWRAEFLGGHAALMAFNPCHALLDILRAPLLGAAPAAASWAGAMVTTALLAGVSWAVFARARQRLALWV